PVALLKAPPRPEPLLEAIHGPPGARIEDQLLDRDRPDRDRRDQKPDHHQLDHKVGVLEQIPDRNRRAGRHGISLRLSLPPVPPKVTKLGRKTRAQAAPPRRLAGADWINARLPARVAVGVMPEPSLPTRGLPRR